MGQCYSVEAQLFFADGDASCFCDTIKNEINSMNGKTAIFNLPDNYELNTPFDCFKAVTSQNAGIYNGIWYADFHGSYGWWSVMVDIFKKALSGLPDGSKIIIWPDSGSTEISVKNGTVTVDNFEDDEEDE